MLFSASNKEVTLKMIKERKKERRGREAKNEWDKREREKIPLFFQLGGKFQESNNWK